MVNRLGSGLASRAFPERVRILEGSTTELLSAIATVKRTNYWTAAMQLCSRGAINDSANGCYLNGWVETRDL
jgi:hypothetical protein